MRLLDLSFPTPEENLAFDEALLEEVEAGRSPSTLRFWECPFTFVVIGSAQILQKEVDDARCVADGIPIMRRCTAGGCVLQGPGSLNFAVALRYEDYPETRDLHQSYCFILDRIAKALSSMGFSARHEGICDIAVEGLKVSGNAQRRKKHAFLHHGSLLYRADYEGMSRYIREPADRPDYRGARNHGEFVGEIITDPETLRHAIGHAWNVEEESDVPADAEIAAMHALARDKYQTKDWVYRR